MAEHSTHVEAWTGERELQVSAKKSTVTVSTPETQQGRMHSVIPLEGSPPFLEPHSKILGVTLDTHLHFHKHVQTTEKKVEK